MAKTPHLCKTFDPCNCGTDLRYNSLVKVHFQGGNLACLPVLPQPAWSVEKNCLRAKNIYFKYFYFYFFLCTLFGWEGQPSLAVTHTDRLFMASVLFKTTFLHISLMGQIELVRILINIFCLILLTLLTLLTPQTSHLTPHTSHLTPVLVTYHPAPVTDYQLGGAQGAALLPC